MADLHNPLKRGIKPHGRGARRRPKAVLTCRQETAFLARYLAAELSDPLLQAFEHHLKLCPDCVAFLRTYQTTIRLTREYLAGAEARRTVPPLRLRKNRANR